MFCVYFQSAIKVLFTFSIDKFLKNHDTTFCHYIAERVREKKDSDFFFKLYFIGLFSNLYNNR